MSKGVTIDRVEQKWKIHLYLKVCKTLAEGEELARNLSLCCPHLKHLSILGKVSDLTNWNFNHVSASFSQLATTKINILDITGIGKVFVVGSLSSLLMEQIDGKALGSLDGGLAGILSGYGLSSKKTTYYLEHLRKGNLLVIGWEYASLLKNSSPFNSAGITK